MRSLFARLALPVATLLIICLSLGTTTANANIAVTRLLPQLEISTGFRAVAAGEGKIALAGPTVMILNSEATDLSSAIEVAQDSARLFTDLAFAQGRFFAVGVGESVTVTESSPPTTLINPDSVTVGGSREESRGLTRLVLLEFNAAGEIVGESIFEAPRPLLPRSLKVMGDRIAIAGTIASEKGVQGFLAVSDLSGAWQSFTTFGDASTAINDLANLRTLYGTSSESLAGSNSRGVSDGVIFYLDTSGRLTRVVRSYLASSERAWQSASSAHLAVGSVKRSGTEEVAITKFSAKGDPQWFFRYPGSDPHLDLRTVGFIASKKLSGIASISPKGKSAVFIEYDAKGLKKKSTIKTVTAIPARNLVDLRDGYAIIRDRQGRSQLIPLAP